MQLALLGLPLSGKSTLFDALTAGHQPGGGPAGAGRHDLRSAVVDVPDTRLEALAELFPGRRTVCAKITFADVGGLARAGEGAREALPAPLLNLLAATDGLALVVRAFGDPSVPHPAGEVDARRDLASLHADLLLNDMLIVERRMARLDEEHQRGGRERAVVEREQALFRRVEAALAEGAPLRSLGLSAEERRALAGFGLLTIKPALELINLGEGEPEPTLDPPAAGAQRIALVGQLEKELAELPPPEAAAFRREYGLEQAGVRRVITTAYALLDVITFFTIGDDELRAWRLPRGGRALDAAAAVHTDLARGFIRAEVIAWEELLALGGLTQARARGRLRLEGKEYPVAEGDVIYVRFNL